MKRYQYRPVEQAKSKRPAWLIPAGLLGLAAGLTGLASIGASMDGGTRAGSTDAAEARADDTSASELSKGTSASHDAARQTVEHKFDHCGVLRRTCVVDGDTFWLDGNKVRIADIDTPEISQPQCAAEKTLGDRATDRLVSLLNEGPFELSAIGDRDEDQYGRKLRVVTRNGRSLGDQLVSEGLARTWTGRREPWCQPPG